MARIKDLYLVLLYSPNAGFLFWEHNIEGKNSALNLAENMTGKNQTAEVFKQDHEHSMPLAEHCEECYKIMDREIHILERKSNERRN